MTEEAAFRKWWLCESADGHAPSFIIDKILHELFRIYSVKHFQFYFNLSELKKRIIKYFYLSYKIRYTMITKRIQGPLGPLQIPADWSDKNEYEWQLAYQHNFDGAFWEMLFGPQRDWEDGARRWRQELPSIFQTYTIRSKDSLIVLEDLYDLHEDDEWNYEPEN
jgi:hypothetical protein